MGLPDILSWACFALALAGSAYALAAGVLVKRFARRPKEPARGAVGVTILKPLHGAEPALDDNLASFCRQDYRGPVQIVCGVQDPGDPAIPAVRRLAAAFPAADIDLVVDPTPHGANPKIANLINMARAIRHDLLVVADSDMRVGPDYLAAVVGALERPGVGLATCLYRGAPGTGLFDRLAAMAIDHHFLPGVLLGLELGLARPCFGSTIALRREVLARIGGFEAFADRLADDHAIGAAVRRAGLEVAIPALVIAHASAVRSAGALLRQELRWARTIRAVDPLGFLGSVVTHPVPFALIVLALGPSGWRGPAALAAALLARFMLQRRVDAALGAPPGRWRLGPLRDLLSFLVFIASLFGGAISWRGQRYRVGPHGILISVEERT